MGAQHAGAHWQSLPAVHFPFWNLKHLPVRTAHPIANLCVQFWELAAAGALAATATAALALALALAEAALALAFHFPPLARSLLHLFVGLPPCVEELAGSSSVPHVTPAASLVCWAPGCERLLILPPSPWA